MTSDTFTAKNGTVWDLSNGAIAMPGRQPVIPAGAMGESIREAVMYDYDRRIDRWRDPEDPYTVLYPVTGDEVDVLWEPEPIVVRVTRDDIREGKTGHQFDCAARYFAAHPVVEAWERAKPGEGWMLRVINAEPRLATFSLDGQFRWSDGRPVDLTKVVAGECIFQPGAVQQ